MILFQLQPETVNADFWQALAALVALVQLPVSCIVAVLIWRTLSATQKSVQASERAVLAAEESVKLASESAQNELRAYLSVKLEQIDILWKIFEHERVLFECKLIGKAENFGKTPVHDLRILSRVFYGAEPKSVEAWSVDDDFCMMNAISPGDFNVVAFQTTIIIDRKSLGENSKNLFISINCNYRDVFNRHLESTYRARALNLHSFLDSLESGQSLENLNYESMPKFCTLT